MSDQSFNEDLKQLAAPFSVVELRVLAARDQINRLFDEIDEAVRQLREDLDA